MLVAQTAAGWPGPLPAAWGEQLLTADWDRHPTDVEAHKADAFALLVAGHAWLSALGEDRVEGLPAVAPVVDASLRAGTSALTAELPLADRAVFADRLGELVIRAAAAASSHSPKDRAPLADVLVARVPGLLGALPETEAESLAGRLTAVCDKKLLRALDLKH